MLNFPGKQKALFAAFSVYTNGKKLFAVNETSSQDVIECLHGIRALSIIWIVHGHRVQTYGFFPLINMTQFREVKQHESSQRLIEVSFIAAMASHVGVSLLDFDVDGS